MNYHQWWGAWLSAGYTPIALVAEHRPDWPENIADRAPRSPPNALCGLGLRCGPHSGLIALDAESEPLGRKWLARHPTPMVIRTPRGLHCYYRYDPNDHQPSLMRIGTYAGTPYPVDLLSGEKHNYGRYCRTAPSVRKGCEYRLESDRIVPLIDLPFWKKAWLPASWQAPPAPPRVPLDCSSDTIETARRYVSRIQAVAGAGGNATTYRVACRVVDYGLGYDDALAVLLDWNATNADPPWSEQAIRQKLDSAYRRND